MSDDLDPGLRRMFAATAEAPADEVFVAGVTARTSRERWLVLLGRAVAGVLLAAVIFWALTAVLAPALILVSGSVAALVSASPFGWVVGLALTLAGVVCVRTLAPLVTRMRP